MYNKEEIKQKLQAGEIQIHFDDKNKIELLRWLTDKPAYEGTNTYYTRVISHRINPNYADSIKISEITEDEEDEEEVVWKSEDMEFRIKGGKWLNMGELHNVEYRLKPKPDFSKEIEALQQKAKENGQRVVITFEKI